MEESERRSLIDTIVQLREEGRTSEQILKRTSKLGHSPEDIMSASREAEIIFLNSLESASAKPKKKTKRRFGVKTVILIGSVGFLLLIYFGYAYASFIFLVLLWAVYRSSGILGPKKPRDTLFDR